MKRTATRRAPGVGQWLATWGLALSAAAVILAVAGTSQAQTTQSRGFMLTGKVIQVDDGDTYALLLDDKSKIKVRMASIDAPESSHSAQESGKPGQPYSQNSRRRLMELIQLRQVEARCFESDKYGRAVCDTFVGGEAVNHTMVSEGWAWANRSGNSRYLRDKSLVGLEAGAKSSGLGLWREPNPIAPWVWRKQCWKERSCEGQESTTPP